MAVDVLVSGIVKTILGGLGSAALQEIDLLWGLKDDLNSLESTFCTIQLVLQDAEVKQRKSEALQNWLKKLKNAAYDAENILDRISTEGLRRRLDSERGMEYQLKSFLSLRNPLLFRWKMVHQVRNIKGKLEDIAKERLDYNLGEGVMERRFGESLENRQTCSLVNELVIVGRNEEKEMMIEKLLDGSCDQDDLCVYAIWGMGGLGKTTLAQLVYNDQRVESYFELRIWVCVSDDFRIQRLVKAIIESLGGDCSNTFELDPLQRHLRERLSGRRFLLVLDDVWNENHRLWDELKEVLRCGSNGSVLMVTTRIEKVALMMATDTIHHVGCLSEDDSWSLFSKRAFPVGEEVGNFVEIGKVIVKKCGGVPLAIKSLGSLMRYKSDENEWQAIKESEIWHLSDDENGILPALRLSYDNLSPQMRQCFAFCCIFPKDYVMAEEELIQLWMANGYLYCADGQTDLHLIGRLIFKELVWRSFFQDVGIYSWGGMRCQMHDIMHDLAMSIMKHEIYIIVNGRAKIPKTLRHLRLNFSQFDYKSKHKMLANDMLRSLIGWGTIGNISALLKKQQYLRALEVRFHNKGKCLPKFICRLEHLRYLVLSCSYRKRLPESLTHLINLQTLKLTNSNKLLELPKGLRVMKNLWFLDMDSFDLLLCTPPGLGDLTCLQRLSIFIVGEDESTQVDQLKELNLGGKLSIKGLDNVRNFEDARSANLKNKKNLVSLSLSWTKGIPKTSEHFDEVLEGLQPHQDLQYLSINSYQGSKFPNWMSTLALKKLTNISLKDCARCAHIPPLGKLRSLTTLHLCGMDSVKRLDAQWHGDGETSFPTLASLKIHAMPNLEEWSMGDLIGSFPRLNDLEITDCPKLIGLPKLQALRELTIKNCNAALLGSIPCLTSLTSLVLVFIQDLDAFPEGLLQNHKDLENLEMIFLPIMTLSNLFDNCSSLKKLTIAGCSNIEFLPEGLKYLNSLERLEISSCDSLRSFPAAILETGLCSLRSLKFQNSKKLMPLSGSLKEAPALHELSLNGLPELEQLPESMQLLTGLRSLKISCCKGLLHLPNWLSRLESLSSIQIMSCGNLKSLPDAFRSLASLREFHILDNPALVKRCKRLKGEDWPKISHIPIIKFDGQTIQRLDH